MSARKTEQIATLLSPSHSIEPKQNSDTLLNAFHWRQRSPLSTGKGRNGRKRGLVGTLPFPCHRLASHCRGWAEWRSAPPGRPSGRPRPSLPSTGGGPDVHSSASMALCKCRNHVSPLRHDGIATMSRKPSRREFKPRTRRPTLPAGISDVNFYISFLHPRPVGPENTHWRHLQLQRHLEKTPRSQTGPPPKVGHELSHFHDYFRIAAV